MQTAITYILTQPSPAYPIIFFFCGSEGIMNMMDLSEGKWYLKHIAHLVNSVLAKEEIEYFYYIYITAVI